MSSSPFVNGPGDNPFDLSAIFKQAQEDQAKAAFEEYNREDASATAEVLAKVAEYLVNEKGYSPELARQAAFLTAQGHYQAFHNRILVQTFMQTFIGLMS